MGGSSAFSSAKPDTLFKFVLIGASNSGKTSLLLLFVEGNFLHYIHNTVEIDFRV